jgi:hypothetical protein
MEVEKMPGALEDQVQEIAREEDAAADEAKRLKGRELDDALYAALLSRAHSDEARTVVDTVTKIVAEHELAGGTRTNRRDKKQAALRLAVEALLADLLQAQASEKAKGYVYRTVRPEGFTGQRVGYRTFKSLVDAMLKLGLLENYKGFQAWSDGFGAPLPWLRKATRYRATKALLDIYNQHGIHAADFHKHFLIPLPDNPLRLHAASRRTEYGTKITGKPLRFEATALTKKLEHQIKHLNEFLDGFELQDGIHRGYIRVFNNGDDPDFNWNMGGRLYSSLESSYQQMERADRLRMKIAGAPVCEIDIRASYLTIFHACHGQQLDATNDPYDLPGLGTGARDVVKMWITATFGNNAPISKWPSDLVAKYRERTGTKLGKHYSASKIGKKVMQAFPLLANLSQHKDGRGHGWAELMYLESQAMLATMLELMNDHIPSLAVHDSIIVPVVKEQQATSILKKCYRRITKATPVLVPHRPEGYQAPGRKEDPWNF